MDAEHKEGLVLIGKALLVLCDLQKETNLLLKRQIELLNELKPSKWYGGPR